MSAPYRPGPQWPDNRPQRPERPPPIQFRQEEPPPAPNKALQWTMRIAGLVAVAVVSGLVWSYIIADDDQKTPTNAGQENTTQDSGGRYTFTPHEEMPAPEKDTDCVKHAYNDVKEFLEETPCDHLTRQLFVTDFEGRTVYTSVSLVVMRTEEDAEELRSETDKEGSGNINDVVREGMVKIPGLKNLSGGNGYKAKQSGREVTIVESAFDPKDKGPDKKADEKDLDAICDDALRLVAKMDAEAGSG